MDNIIGKIVDKLEQMQMIQSKDTEMCKYGLGIFMSSMIEIISILLISAFVGNFVETLLLFLMFVPLRIYAGGYHANTRLSCYFVSLGMYVFFTATLVLLPISAYVITNIICSLFSCFAVYLMAPVIHYNKTINLVEKENYRKISIKICLVETIIILLVTSLLPTQIFASAMVMGQVAVVSAMIVGMLKQKITQNKI